MRLMLYEAPTPETSPDYNTGVVAWPLGWEMLGDISYDEANLKSEGK